LSYRYDRHVRTPYSEGYEIHEDGRRVGHVDLHYASQEVYASLILEREMDEDSLLALIEQLDNDLVLSSEMPRQDFLVSVYAGRDIGLYNDDYLRERFSGHAEDPPDAIGRA
jgi:hypothetical protein